MEEKEGEKVTEGTEVTEGEGGRNGGTARNGRKEGIDTGNVQAKGEGAGKEG
jgi:hypothetical protein